MNHLSENELRELIDLVVHSHGSYLSEEAFWTTDITYLDTGEGWLYLRVMLDLFSRQVVGWSIQPRMTQLLVVDAFAHGVV